MQKGGLVNLGPGSKWSRVLKILPPSKYTVVHGQCTDVGVGGYLLGGGVNVAGSATHYGIGAENVLEYTMVTADGEVVVVDKDYVVKKTLDGKLVMMWKVASYISEHGLFSDYFSAQQR